MYITKQITKQQKNIGGATGLNCSMFLLQVLFSHLPGGLLLLEHFRKVIQHSVPKQLKVTQLFKTGHVLC